MNQLILLGRLGETPELRTTPNGNHVSNLSIATSKKVKDKTTSSFIEKTTWHRVTVWGPLAENCCQYLKKGSQVFAECELSNDSYMKDDEKIYQTVITANRVDFLSPKNGEL
jgi:single-strand DNA-binding protein